MDVGELMGIVDGKKLGKMIIFLNNLEKFFFFCSYIFIR